MVIVAAIKKTVHIQIVDTSKESALTVLFFKAKTILTTEKKAAMCIKLLLI